jgi:hypothetical protein
MTEQKPGISPSGMSPENSTRDVAEPIAPAVKIVSERAIRESMMGIGEAKIDAEDALIVGYRHQNQEDPRDITHNEVALRDQGLDGVVDASDIPRIFVGNFTPRQRDRIAHSSCPALTIHSIINATNVNQWFDHSRYNVNFQFSEKENSRYAQEYLIVGMPLVQSTSTDAFVAAMQEGKFVSNRLLEERGVDLSSDGHTGMTMLKDRELGLNNYVFMDFGRPRTDRLQYQSEVVVVFSQDAMQQPGTFITEQDILDCWKTDNNGKLVTDFDKYLQGFYYPDDFLKIVGKRLAYEDVYEEGASVNARDHNLGLHKFLAGKDGGSNGSPRPSFTGWEVKIPEVSTNFIEKVIVRDKDTYTMLTERFGDSVSFVHEPFLKGNIGILQNHDLVDKELHKKAVEDYEHRWRILKEADPNTVHEGWFPVYMRVSDGSEPILDRVTDTAGFELKLKPGQDLYAAVEELQTRTINQPSHHGKLSNEEYFFFSNPGKWARVKYAEGNLHDGVVLEVRAHARESSRNIGKG